MAAISESRIHLEGALTDSERFLTTLMANLPGMVYRCKIDRAWTMTFVSDGAKALTGYEPQDLIDNKRIAFGDMIHPEDRDLVETVIHAALGSQEAFTIDYRIKSAAGAIKWVREHGRGVWYDCGRFNAIEGFVVDISEQKAVELALDEKTRRLRLAEDVAGLGHWQWNLESGTLELSDQVNRIYGVDPGAFEANLETVFAAYHPTDRAMVQEQLQAAIDSRQQVRFNARIVRPDGSECQVAVVGSPCLNADGTVAALFGVVQDVTDQMRTVQELSTSKAFLQTVLDTIEDGVIACDAEAKPIVVNATTRRFQGLEDRSIPPEEWANHFDIYHADGKTPMSRDQMPLDRALAGETVQNAEMVIVPNGGQPRHLRAKSRPLCDAKGRRLGAVASMHDITDLKHADCALGESESRFRTAFLEAPYGVALIEQDGTFMEVNRVLCDMLGYSEQELVGSKFSNYTHPDDVAGDLANVRRGFIGEFDNYHREKRYLHKSGEIVWVLVCASIIRDQGGSPLYLVAQFVDLRGQKKADAALRHSEARFRGAFEAAPNGIGMVGLDGQWLAVNQAFCDIAGYTEAELLQTDFQSITHPDDLEEDLSLVGQLRVGAIESYQREKRYIHKKGHEVPVWLCTALVRDADGSPHHWISHVVDMTDRKRAEAELRESEEYCRGIMDSVADVIITFDKRGMIVTANRSVEKIFDYTADEVIGHNIAMLIAEPYGSNHDSYITRTLETGQSKIIGYGAREVTARRKDGTTFACELAIGEIRSGENVGCVGSVRDITERKQTEAQLQQVQKMDALGELTGGVAHDFNNLLTVILGNSQLLVRSLGDNEQTRQLVDGVLAAGKRAAELTGRLLAFSRRQVLETSVVDVREILSNMDDLLRRSLGEDVELEIVLTEGLEPVEIDLGQLENAILNLAINARDAMPDGGRLLIEAMNRELDIGYTASHSEVAAGDYVCITISDTGTGMPSDVIEHVLEPFFTTKEEGKGTGLGLSMVYGFIKQSKGHINIYSEEGHGTTLTLYLPQAKNSETSDPPTVQNQSVLPGQGETILVVEDDAMVRRIAERLLKDLGYRIYIATDGPSALAVIEENGSLDLLFTDVVMPGGMKGPELAARVRKKIPDLKVLFASGYTQEAFAREGLPENAGFISKPYELNELASRVRTILDGGQPQSDWKTTT